MAADDYLADYLKLGLAPGCGLLALERAWRRSVSALHPDRGGQADAVERGERLRELSAAYQRLRQFEREHGRLPGESLPTPPTPAAALMTAAVLPAAERDVDTADPRVDVGVGVAESASTRSRLWLLPVLVLVALGFAQLGWESEAEPAAASAVQAPPQWPASTVNLLPSTKPAAAAKRIRIGSSEATVERLMGTPMVLSPELWEYGPSHVRFRRGRVIGWYSSPLMPLPVDQGRR